MSPPVLQSWCETSSLRLAPGQRVIPPALSMASASLLLESLQPQQIVVLCGQKSTARGDATARSPQQVRDWVWDL